MRRRHFLALGAAGLGTMIPAALAVARGRVSSDLEIIRQALGIHPGALRYNTPTQLEQNVQAFEADWEARPAIEARFLALSALLGTLRCGHTHCNLYNQSESVEQRVIRPATRLPFLFVWRGNRMIITSDHSGTDMLPPGTEVLTLNGKRASAVLDDLWPYTRADGSNDGKRRAQLSVTPGEPYPAFDVFQGLLHPPSAGRFVLEIRRPDGARVVVDVPASTFDDRLAMSPPPPPGDQPLWSWTQRDDGIALLTMPTWVVYRGSWDWRGWLTERLDGLTGARGLIVDIRGNEGGLNCGDEILARLTRQDLVLDAYEPRVRFRRSPPDMDAYFETFSPGFRTLGEQGVPLEGGFFGYPPERPADRIKARGSLAGVPTAILCDSHNSSATFNFAQRVKQFGLARLFGEQTGGNLRGINAGAMFFVRLPESGLEFDLPLIGYFAKTPQPDRGVLPDVAVTRTPADIAAGADPVLDAATAWITGR